MFAQNGKFTPFEKRKWLSSPTMHGEEIEPVHDAVANNWVSTIEKNINEVESLAAKKVGCKYAVGLSSGTSAIHHICGDYGAHPL